MNKIVACGIVSGLVCGIVIPGWAGEPVLIDVCPEVTSVSQPPSEDQTTPGFSGDGDDLRAYDDFAGNTGPISGIVWWGGGVSGGECVVDGDFEVSFYERNGGQPGDLITTREVSPTSTTTGYVGQQGTIYRYEATFDTPVNLVSGWISVFATGFDACYFYWGNSASGNGIAYSSIGIGLGADFAFCLLTEGLFAETSCPAGAGFSQAMSDTLSVPGFSDAGDGLRSYDNFSGLTDPIVSVVWWGGGTNGGNNCDRNTDYEISFYQTNGGQPGSLIASENVTTSVTATGTSTSFGSLYRHEAVLSTPVDLASGWISVYGINFTNCYFFWMNSDDGDGNAATTNGSISADFAFCLITEDGFHTADQDQDNEVSLSELLRVIQFFNSNGYGCELGTEDGYTPNDPDQACAPHDSDYNAQDWAISLSELLRLIQFFNSGGYFYCPEEDPATEDNYCPGTP